MDIDDSPSTKPFTESKDGLACPLTDSVRAGHDWATIAAPVSGPLEGELQAGFLPTLPLEALTLSESPLPPPSSPTEAEEATAGSITGASGGWEAGDAIGSGLPVARAILFHSAGACALAVAPLVEKSALEPAIEGRRKCGGRGRRIGGRRENEGFE